VPSSKPIDRTRSDPGELEPGTYGGEELADVSKALASITLDLEDVGTHYVERRAEIGCNHPEDRRGSVDRRVFTFDTRRRVEEEGETVHPVPDTTDLCHCGSYVDTVLLPGLHDYLVSRHGVQAKQQLAIFGLTPRFTFRIIKGWCRLTLIMNIKKPTSQQGQLRAARFRDSYRRPA